MRCIIVGDGPSAAGFVPPDGVPVIAVKRAIRWLSRADYWFSLDPNPDSFDLMRNQRAVVRYFCACPDDKQLPAGVTRLHRVIGHGPEPSPRDTPEWWFWRWACVPGLCEEPGSVHTGNSAWGALGLAYHLGFRHVLLVGIDGTQDARLSDGKSPRNLSHLPMLFGSARRQVDLQTAGTLGSIPRTTLTDWLGDTE